MLERVNFKKEYFLIAGGIILLFAAYQFAFKRTIEAWQLHQEFKQQVQRSGDLSIQPNYIQRKNRNLDEIISLYKADTINYRSNILGKISALAQSNDVKLSEVPSDDALYRTPHFIIQKLTFDGDYFDLEKTLNKLQATPGIGMIRSANLRKVGSYTSSETAAKTIMEVYLEVIN